MAPVSLRFLASPSSDTSDIPTVLLQCDAKKYMFNAGEGTTRLSAQYRSSNTRVEHLFLTRIASETIGGVPGLLMTLADGGRSGVHLHGPPNLEYALATTRFYARRESMAVHTHEMRVDEPHVCFSDEHIEVQAVPLVPSLLGALPSPPAPSDVPWIPGQEPWRSAEWRPSALQGAEAQHWYKAILSDAWKTTPTPPEERGYAPSRSPHALPPPWLPPATHGSEAGRQVPIFAYIVAGQEQRGKFDAARAAELGIPPGPAYARLTRGEDVDIERPKAWSSMSADERQQWLRRRKKDDISSVPTDTIRIHSTDVVGPSRPGTVFVYCHVPSSAYLEALLTAPAAAAFAPYQVAANATSPPEQRRTPHVMLHATPMHVYTDARYAAWRATFGPDCHHIVANREVCADSLSYTSSAVSLLRLSQLDENVFRVPGYTTEPKQQVSDAVPVQRHMLINMQPRGSPMLLPEVAPVFDKPIAKMSNVAALSGALAPTWQTYCAMADIVRSQPPVPPASEAAGLADDVQIVTLGTGSSAPSKYRNVLSTLLCLPDGDGYILLDAGESTYFQLARYFGPGERGWHGVGIETVLRQLRMIFISHIHGDHHMGVARLLLARRQLAPSRPLILISNNYTRFYLREYDRLEHLGLRDGSVLTIDNATLDWRDGIDPDPHVARDNGTPPRDVASLRVLALLTQYSHLASVRTVAVQHRASHCYGVILTHQRGWSIAFSGDTMPCDALADAAQGATVLIHEATMQDEEAELAAQKGHSTIGQALHIAQKMNAAHVLLTHFSQRYPKLARLSTSASENARPVGIAFDMTCMTPADIRRLIAAHPAMALVLEAEPQADDEDEENQGNEAKANTHTAPPPMETSPKRPRAHRTTRTQTPYQYLVVTFVAQDPAQRAPSELSVRQGLAQALEQMHGVVHGAVALDVLYAGPPQEPTPRVVGEAVVRVATEHMPTLTSAVSSIAGPALHTITGHQPGMRVQLRTVSHNVAMTQGDSRAWMKQWQETS